MVVQEKVDALATAETRIAELEAEVAELEAEVAELEAEIAEWAGDHDSPAAFFRALAEDRERLLAAVGVTDHEWWCGGGERLQLVLERVAKMLEEKEAKARGEEEEDLPPVAQENVHVEEDLGPPPFDWLDPVDNFSSVGQEPLTVAEAVQEAEAAVVEEAKAVAETKTQLDVVERFKESLRKHVAKIEAEDYPPLPEDGDGVPVLGGLFSGILDLPDVPDPLDVSLTDEQAVAFDEVVEWFERSDEPCFSLTGPAGCGKTFLVRKLAEYFSEATLCAMTGKAAHRVREMTGRSASTLHSVLYFPPAPGADLRFTRLREVPSELVVVDEASQMTPSVKKDIGRWDYRIRDEDDRDYDRTGSARVLLVGDPYQLPPVITGKELEQYGESYSVFSEVEGASLKTVMRNAGGVLRAATRVRETGEMCTASDMDGEGEGYSFVRDADPVGRAVKDWLEDRDDHLLVSWRNAVRMRANRMIRAALGHGGPLPDEGEPVLIRRNGQGFLNGEVVACGGFEAGPEVGSLQTLWMHVQGGGKVLVTVAGGRDGEMMDGGAPWIVDWRRYHADLRRLAVPEPTPISFGYVHTCHTVQGSEARRVTVFLDRGDERSTHFQKATSLPDGTQAPFSARFFYTALTRGKCQSTLMVGR